MLQVKTIGLTLLLTTLSVPAFAQQWAEQMFEKREHNFGTVAAGSDTVYKFKLTNKYKQTMNIVGVRTSCGCTTPTIENGTFKTHESAYIVCRFNTHSHSGQKGATVTVTFGAPYPAEVQVRVHGNIRSDVVFSPGAIEFGEVAEGSTREQVINVTYAGRETWEILDVTNDNEHFEVELKEKARGNGRVSYALLVRLKDDLPVGYLKDQLTILTNDVGADAQRIPLFIGGRIRPEFSITPENIVLGTVAPGQDVVKRIVVRGSEPFKITEVKCEDNHFDFKVDPASKRVHLVEVRFKAGEQAGKMRAPIRILTDRGKNRGATCVVSAIVVPDLQPASTFSKQTAASTPR
ncbi:DUF1573 domain-containing protein [Adhaeretor mobilis]|uniref:DUF1573 domain-containing protein n=1 Tax=Adhaeretor mobilis TaxID=1930276 RepID=A0A517MTZ6_9BACT|nr:DUF1573 domain-containing protein [Adhaeretor mobilis]QDS98360.1 hypothetical protein HG15A2_16340 [Adhaeretor mobilis]